MSMIITVSSTTGAAISPSGASNVELTVGQVLGADPGGLGDAIASAQQAAEEALVSETNAAVSEVNAGVSEVNSAASASASANSAALSEQSNLDAEAHKTAAEAASIGSIAARDAAASSATDAETAQEASEDAAAAASASESRAATSETNAGTSETNAAASEANAATSEANAATSETNADASESSAAISAAAAQGSEERAGTSETNAASSAAEALVSAGNASVSESNAATSETNAASSESNALVSASNSEASESNAKTSELNTAASEAAAATSETNAAASASAALESEGNAATSEASASTSADNSEASAAAAALSESSAAVSEANAATAATNAGNSESLVEAHKDAAALSEVNASASEGNAAISEANALNQAGIASTKASEASTSASNASDSEVNAKASELAAKTSETNASTSEVNAKTSETNSKASETASAASAANASSSEANALISAGMASDSETNAAYSEGMSRKWAIEDEDVEVETGEYSAKHHATKAQAAAVSTGEDAASAEASKDAAALSEVNAKASETSASNSASSATGSASAASTSASTASSAADAANTSAVNAGSSESASAAHKDAAALSESNAKSSEDIAVQKATEASTSASGAATSEANAGASESNAADSATLASTKAAAAEGFAYSAQNSETGAQTAETNAEASAVRAEEAAASASAEAPWETWARTQADMEAEREANKNLFAASGEVSYEGDGSGTQINEGMWVDGTTPNTITYVGEKHVAGLTNDTSGLGVVKLPQAPNGTVIYDSTGDCRGSGKATLDLSTEVDPKYGDIAQDDNEAVARAFEGDVKNGDFRFGDDGSWTQSSSIQWLIANGYASAPSGGFGATSFLTTSINSVTIGEPFVLQFFVDNLASGTVKVSTTNGSVDHEITSEGLHTIYATNPVGNLVFFKGIVGDEYRISNVSIKPVTEEVVINPVDMYGMEHYLEAVTEANPYVYAGGMPQTQATTMNGITCTRSNRPDTYYSVFDGDLDSTGLGVDFFAATDEQKKAMLSDESNSLYLMDDGTLKQRVGAQTTVRSLGNGDWYNVNPTNGALQSVDGSPVLSRFTGLPYLYNDELGVFDDGAGSYFHVWGRVPRLNQGAYHPLNLMGTAAFGAISGDNSVPKYWYRDDSWQPSSVAECFTHSTTYIGFTGALPNDPTIRPDGLAFDAIYPSGQGGVIDDRLPAHDMGSPEEAAKQDAKVKNGSFRGEEYLVRTSFDFTLTASSANALIAYKSGGSVSASDIQGYIPNLSTRVGGTCVVYNVSKGEDVSHLVAEYSGGAFVMGAAADAGDTIMLTTKTNIPVEGNATQGFSCQTVYGPPEKILTSSLSQGWLGTWGGLSETSPLTLTRKALSAQSAQVSADGSSWTSSTPSLNRTLNEATVSFNTDDIVIINYTAGVYPTEQDINRPVLNGEQGLGSVSVISNHSLDNGGIFKESLIGKVEGATAFVKAPNQNLPLLNSTVLGNGYITSGREGYAPAHNPLDINPAPNAVKALMYQTSENQLLHLNYAYNEIAYDSVDNTWNDDSTISVLTGQGTYTNQGAVTLLAGTNRTSKPYGYSKNKARVGSQVDGVDL